MTAKIKSATIEWAEGDGAFYEVGENGIERIETYEVNSVYYIRVIRDEGRMQGTINLSHAREVWLETEEEPSEGTDA